MNVLGKLFFLATEKRISVENWSQFLTTKENDMLKLKKFFIISLVLFVAVAFSLPADAKEFSKGEQRIGRALCQPFKLVAEGIIRPLGQTLTLQKPLAFLGVTRKVRQEATDLVETVVRVVIPGEALEIDEPGTVTAAITEAGPIADAIVDGVVYGVAAGVIIHNGNVHNAGLFDAPLHHVGKAAATVFGIAAAADIVDSAVEGDFGYPGMVH